MTMAIQDIEFADVYWWPSEIPHIEELPYLRYAKQLASRFEDLAEADYPKGLLHQQVVNGTLQFRIVGSTVPQYAVWYYIQADQMLHANAMLSLSKVNRIHEMFDTLDTLAKELNCKGVIFETRWHGMIRQCQRQGYRQSAVVMRKDFVEKGVS